ERACIGLLHQVFCLLTGGDQAPRHAVDLVGEVERLLLEAHPVARLLGKLPGVRLGSGLAHRRATLASSYLGLGTPGRPVSFPFPTGTGGGRRPAWKGTEGSGRTAPNWARGPKWTATC